MYKLPEPLLSWAWKPEYIQEERRSEGGIILPGETDDRPGLVHFSQLLEGGVEHCWLWFFPFPAEAIALRLLPTMTTDANSSLVKDTIPSGAPDPALLLTVDPGFIRGLPLESMNIHEVWLGFDYRKYVNDRNLKAATTAVMTSYDFCQVASR